MDTFLIFVFIFGLFAWGMWRLLKYTRDTVGENSPLKMSRVYQISEFRYFTGFEGIITFGLFVMAIILSFMIFRIPVSSNDSPMLVYVMLFLMLIVFWGSGVLNLILLLNNWKYIKGVVIITHPDHQAVEVKLPDRTFMLHSGDVERIDSLSAGDSRMSNWYLTYHLRNGEHFTLSGRMPGYEVISEYFPEVETTWTHKRFVFLP
ncbi:hypothetical protein [Persicitalea sp.]|uniref:hypothetical protein n=1 Tax=Persicitalea sp. TaxID=3100273 RepID=UPI0035938582